MLTTKKQTTWIFAWIADFTSDDAFACIRSAVPKITFVWMLCNIPQIGLFPMFYFLWLLNLWSFNMECEMQVILEQFMNSPLVTWVSCSFFSFRCNFVFAHCVSLYHRVSRLTKNNNDLRIKINILFGIYYSVLWYIIVILHFVHVLYSV